MEGKMYYREQGFDADTAATQDFATSKINLARDLSAANRKGMHMTTTSGVPLNYHCRLTIWRNIVDDRVNSSLQATVFTAQDNYVTRNASVQLHAAREAMFRNAGIKKSQRGRYDKTLRLGWDAAGISYSLPSFTDGASTFTDVGEWDESIISIKDDATLVPVLFGPVLDETTVVSGDTFNITNAYLNSRRKLDEDDLDAGDGAAAHSLVRSMFNVEDTQDPTIQATADDNQDKPPYDQDAAAGTFTSKSVGGVGICGNYGSPKDVVDFTAPFGLAEIAWAKYADSGGDLSGDIYFQIEVLGISEMQ